MQFYLIFNSSILPVLIKLFCPTGKCNEKVWSIEHNVHQGQAVLPSYSPVEGIPRHGRCKRVIFLFVLERHHISSIIPASKYSFRPAFLAVVFRVEIPRFNLLKAWRDVWPVRFGLNRVRTFIYFLCYLIAPVFSLNSFQFSCVFFCAMVLLFIWRHIFNLY